jgi:4-alpha-glucanotransferase
MNVRTSGILLPISCLPSRFGIGDLGPRAYGFVDFLCEAKQHVWQILPLNPTRFEYGHSPYQSPSAFAFNPLLISPELMVDDGFLDKKDLKSVPKFPKNRIDYQKAHRFKEKLFDRAFERFQTESAHQELLRFCAQNAPWLEDFSRFTAFKAYFGGKIWNQWPLKIRNRTSLASKTLAAELKDAIARTKFLQFIFFTQWTRLKTCCNRRGIHIFGDIPIYVPYDSADTWADPTLFKLDNKKRPSALSGVPPDYFSDTGQLWGHPVYRWQEHQSRRYDWWIRRIAHNLDLFDYIRIDHFRGLVAYWEVPAHEKTAVNGKWVEVPAEDFFDEMLRHFACLPVIAEDLGYITADVREIMHRYEFPGMRLLVFGFMNHPANNPNAPHNIPKNCAVYTGTHDTNTIRGWFEEETTEADKQQLFRYLGRPLPADELPREIIRLAMMSPANLSIIAMQDLLGLDARARINRPGRADGNWLWRITENQMAVAPTEQLRELTEMYARG